MAADALDGDARGLREGGRGGGNGDPLGYGAVRPAGSGGNVSGDAFHLTPHDVRKQEFRRSLRGYEPLGVEDFRVRVADELERILRERSVLEERLAALGEQLGVYRERERAMNEALVAGHRARRARGRGGGGDADPVRRDPGLSTLHRREPCRGAPPRDPRRPAGGGDARAVSLV